MQFRDDDLLGIRVEGTSGRRVGRLVGFVIDGESGIVLQYRVCPPGFLASVVPGIRELLVSRDQVVSIDTKRMLVRDGAVRDAGGGRRTRPTPSMAPQPLTSKSD